MDQILSNGRLYTRLDSCSVGNYGGDGAVGLANLKTLMKIVKNWNQVSITHLNESPDNDQVYVPIDAIEIYLQGADLLIVKYDFGGQAAFLAEDYEEYKDIVAALADYPLLDDQEHWEVEHEWEIDFIDTERGMIDRSMVDQFEEILLQKLERLGVPEEHLEGLIEKASYEFVLELDGVSTDAMLALVHRAMEVEQTQFAYEYNGVWADLDKLASRIYEEYGKGEEIINRVVEELK